METIKTPCGHEYDEEVCPARHKAQIEFRKTGRRVDFPGCITCPHFVTKSADKPQEEKLKNKTKPETARTCEEPGCNVVISKDNKSGLCRKHSCAKNQKKAHKTKPVPACKPKNKTEKIAKTMPASQLCREQNIQNCNDCDDLTCGDNMRKPVADDIHAKLPKPGEVLYDSDPAYSATAMAQTALRKKCPDFKPVDPLADIYRRAIQRYGDRNQILKTAEEASELSAAIMRYLSMQSDNGMSPVIKMVEELADVEIMCRQMRLIFGDQPVDAAVKMKLERLEGRLNDE